MDFKVLLSSEDIQKRVGEMAEEISEKFRNNPKPPLLVGILKGSFIFLADLFREMKIPAEVDFMELSSYGAGTETSGEVKIIKDLRVPIEGRDVVVVEDIVDTGLTLQQVLKMLEARQPKSLSICSLLHKPSRERVKVPISFLGFKIEDHFVVGYGLDVAESLRHLKDIVIYEPEKTGN